MSATTYCDFCFEIYGPAGEYMFGLSAEGIDQIAKAYAEDE